MKFNKCSKIFIGAFLLWLLIHISYTIMDGRTDKGYNADIALILGNKVNADGTLSERLIKRLECGLDLYKKGRVKKIIVSGGLGKEGFCEGDKMKSFLTEHGVTDTAVITDNNGNNTIASVNNTLKLKDILKFKSIIVVSQYFHLTRTKMLFRKRNFDSVSSVSPRYWEMRDVYSLLREFGAYYTE